MKRLLLILSFFLCSQTCFAEERIVTYILKDGTEVSGEDLGSINGVIHKVRTDSGIVEVHSNDIDEFSYEVNFSWEDLGMNDDDVDKFREKLSEYVDNNSDYQNDYSEKEYNNSDYQNNRFEKNSTDSTDSDYQNENSEDESYNNDYQNENSED